MNARDILLQVADAFNAVLGHVNDEEVPVEDSDSGEEVDVEEVPEDVAAPRRDGLKSFVRLMAAAQVPRILMPRHR